MKKITLLLAVTFFTAASFAQMKTTTSAIVSFDATTPKDLKPIAENKTVIAALDTKKGTVAFEALINSFNFSNSMMQDHFNGEKWMDAEKNPKATFTGTISNLKSIKFTTDGTYTADVEGDLTMHGITKPVKTTATFTVKNKAISATAAFTVKLVDYALGNANGKLADEPKITVVAEF